MAGRESLPSERSGFIHRDEAGVDPTIRGEAINQNKIKNK
jgi:hypothetical protein